MNRELQTFQSKCQKCRHVFFRPSLGDFAYGEVVLSTADGRCLALVSAFDEFPSRLSKLIKTAAPEDYWPLVASFADPVDGQPLISGLICPACASSSFDYWEGEQASPMWVQKATFLKAEDLEDSMIIQMAKSIIHHDRNA